MTGQINVNKIAARTGTTITVDTGDALDVTLVKGEGTATTNLKQGLAKSWCNFQGTSTISIHDSFNVTDLTDVGTGQYKVNYTTAMASDKYGYSFCANAQTDVGMDNNATTYCHLFVRQGWDTTTIDIAEPCCIIHGDLA